MNEFRSINQEDESFLAWIHYVIILPLLYLVRTKDRWHYTLPLWCLRKFIFFDIYFFHAISYSLGMCAAPNIKISPIFSAVPSTQVIVKVSLLLLNQKGTASSATANTVIFIPFTSAMFTVKSNATSKATPDTYFCFFFPVEGATIPTMKLINWTIFRNHLDITHVSALWLNAITNTTVSLQG